MELFGFRFTALGGQNEIQLYADNRSIAEELAQLAISETLRIERKFSVFQEDSIMAEIRRSAGNYSIEIDNETASLIDFATSCFVQSEKLFDITTGPLRRLWDFKQKIVPKEDCIIAAKRLCGFEKIKRETSSKLFLESQGMELDFGGFGKEYAVDRATAILSQNQVTHALINLGGDIRALGPRQDETPWSIGLAHPRRKNFILRTIPLFCGALATSGDYERYFEIAGRRYCHIINPLTGYPVDELQAVTVIADSCLVAGTLSTIAMLVGQAQSEELLEDHRHLIVNQAGNVIDKVKSEWLADKIPHRIPDPEAAYHRLSSS